MLDINLLRRDLGGVIAKLERREKPQPFLDVDAFSSLELRRKSLQVETEQLQAKRKLYSAAFGQLKRQGAATDGLAARHFGDVDPDLRMHALEAELADIQARLHALLMSVPNLPHDSVPVGVDESANFEVRRWGSPREFGFTPKDHVELGMPLGLDFETGAKLSGSRFTFLRGPVARLHRALAQLMLDMQTQQHGYTECWTPYIVNREILEGTGQLPKFKDDMFWVFKGGAGQAVAGGGDAMPREQYLISTSEISLANSVREQIVELEQLPIKLTAHTPCFRSEAGSAGRDTRGFIRQHQFDKVEMVQVVHPERSYDTLDEMVGHAEAVLNKLELPYRVMLLASGDLGFGSTKTFDLEVWLPGQNAFREISSCSNCEAFQARRMQTRFRNAQGKTEFVHTLNGSGVAVGRALVAVLENHQNADGSIAVPAALRPYLGGAAVLRASA